MKLKNKLFVIITLVLLVVGMTLFGVLGFNQTVDNKKSYEVRVSVTLNIQESKETLLTETNAFFNEKGIKPQNYAFQTIGEGKTLIYKFNKQVDVSGLQEHLKSKIENNDVVVENNEVIGNSKFDIGWLLLALGLSALAIFVYAIIMEKLAASVAVISSSVASFVMFVALMGILRIPAYPFVGVSMAVSMILGAALSLATSTRLREEYKNVERPDVKEISEKVMKEEGKKYLSALVAVAIGAIALSVFLSAYMVVVAGQLVVAGLVGCAMSYFLTPIIWSAIKGRKK